MLHSVPYIINIHHGISLCIYLPVLVCVYEMVYIHPNHSYMMESYCGYEVRSTQLFYSRSFLSN